MMIRLECRHWTDAAGSFAAFIYSTEDVVIEIMSSGGDLWSRFRYGFRFGTKKCLFLARAFVICNCSIK